MTGSDWLAEIWKWIEANLVSWALLWWFLAAVFLLSALARWLVWGRRWRSGAEPGWGSVLALGVTASGWGDWRRLAARFASPGTELEFVTAVLSAHVLPVYVLLIVFALGKEYLVVYLVAVLIFFPLVLAPARLVLAFPGGAGASTSREPAPRTSMGMSLVRELGGFAPRFGYGVLVAGVLAAVAIQPEWAFPVEITGTGLVAQVLNAVLGIVLAVGAWTPPVGAFLLGVPLWRGGFALAGLLAFLLAVPAAPQAAMAYAEWVGSGQAGRLVVLILLAALVAALATTALVAAVGLELPYLYAPEQLL